MATPTSPAPNKVNVVGSGTVVGTLVPPPLPPLEPFLEPAPSERSDGLSVQPRPRSLDGPFPWLARAALAASRRSSVRTANPLPQCAAPAYVPWPSSSCIPKKPGTPVIDKWSETSRSPLELRSRRLVVEPAEELSATSTLPPRELRPLNIARISRPVAPARFDNHIGPANPGVGRDRTAAPHTRATRSWRVSGRRGVPII
jgi:hypothetical protein